jgi:hypothetical protein
MLTATLTRLDQIRELLPPHTTVGFLVNPDNSELLLAIEQIARSTGQPLVLSPKIEGREGLSAANATMRSRWADSTAVFPLMTRSRSSWFSVMFGLAWVSLVA